DHRCDLFSLGCVLYRTTTGQLPFKGKDSMAIMMAVATKNPDPPREVDPLVPAPLSELIMQLLAKDPDERPRNAKAVREAIEAIERHPANAPAPPPPHAEDGDLKPIDDDDAGLKEDSADDVVLLEVDDNAAAVDEVEEVEEVVEEDRSRRSRSG